MHTATSKSKVQQKKSYRKVLDIIRNTIEGTGDLVGNHSILQLAYLGCLPCWMREVVHIPDNSKYVSYFNDNFGLSLKGQALDKMVDTLCHNLTQRIGRHFSSRTVENILCKAFRHFSATTRTNTESGIVEKTRELPWADIVFRDQMVFCDRGEWIHFVTAKGQKGCFQQAVFTRFPFGDELLPLRDISTRIRGGNLPRDLVRPRINIQLDFDMPPFPAASLEAKQVARRVVGKKLGRQLAKTI